MGKIFHKLCLLIYFHLYSVCYATYDTVRGGAILPRGFSSAAIGYNHKNKTVLIFGSSDYPKQFIQFDLNTAQFTDISETYLTQGIAGGGTFYSQVGHILWIINSTGTGFITIDTQTYVEYDPSITIPTNIGKYGCLATTDDHLFIVGGTDTGSDLVQVYNISAHTWFNAPLLQTPRKRLVCMTMDNTLYAIAGKNDITKVAFDTIETLDINALMNAQTIEWSYMSGTLNRGVASPSAVQYGTNIIVIGGVTYSANKVADVHLIDTNAASVEFVGSLTDP
eukprot:238073_1